MRAALQQQLQELDGQLDTLFEDLSQYSHEQLNQQPTPDSWCATQVLNHLLLSEKYSRQYCQKKLSFEPDLDKAGMADSFRTFLVSFYFKLPMKVEAPKNINTDALPRESQLDDLKQQYREQREELAGFLLNVDQQYLDKAVYKHPFAGRLSISGMLHFFDAHFAHHRKQIYRVLKVASS
ncbi:MAG: DinB family protein [Bacteroidota bacterium]